MKLKSIFTYLLLTTAFLYFLFAILAPPFVDNDMNKVSSPLPYTPSTKAQQIISEMEFVGDLHCDALLWKRNLLRKHYRGHVDIPRMLEGNMAFQAFTIVTKSPKGQNFIENSGDTQDIITFLSMGQAQPFYTWFSLVGRAKYQCEKLHHFARKSNGSLMVIKSKSDLENLLSKRANGQKVVGGMLGLEGAHALEGKLGNFDILYEAGLRMLGPTHFFDNEMGGSAHGIKKDGLTEFGQEVIKRMNDKNMILDVAHSSEKVIDDVLVSFDGPILSSHTGVYGTHPSPRNLKDRHLEAIAARDGLIGIAFFSEATGGNDVSDIVDAMLYTKNLIGIEHIALGSDWDGSVTTPFDASDLEVLVDGMLNKGLTIEEIKAIIGGNLKRFLLKNLN